MARLKFFDCSAMIVPTPHCSWNFPCLYQPLLGDSRLRTAQQLEEEMKYFGIDHALAYSVKSYLLNPTLGNEELVEHIDGHKRLYSSWVLADNMLSPLVFRRMEEHRVRAVRMSPLFGQTLEEETAQDFLTELENREIPLFLDFVGEPRRISPMGPFTGISAGQVFSQLFGICENHPKLIVVASTRIAGARTLYPKKDRYKNLHLSTSLLGDHHNIEEVVSKLGAERIVFGTYHPRSPAQHVNQIVYADVSPHDKQLVASGNLERILGLPPSEETSRGEECKSSTILETARNGEPLKDLVTIDVHVHACFRGYTEKELISKMDRVGLKKACINHMFAFEGDMTRGNSLVAEAISKYSDHFIGFAIIDPNYPDEDIKSEIKRCFEVLKMKAMKIHPVGHNVHLLDKKYESVWEGAEKYDVPVLSHTTIEDIEGPNADPRHFDILASKYPKVKFILAHTGNCIKGLDGCLELGKKHKNLYMDTSGNTTDRAGVIETMVKEIGADRILFGSDWALFDIPWKIGPVLYAKIPDEDKRKILGENAAKILNLDIE